jgi:hypothetical protein
MEEKKLNTYRVFTNSVDHIVDADDVTWGEFGLKFWINNETIACFAMWNAWVKVKQ